MKIEIIITKDGSHSLYLSDIGETYHSIYGAFAEAIHVFIKNGLHSHPKQSLNILEIGFGTGLNSLLTLDNIQDKKVHYTSLEPFPVSEEFYTKLNFHTLTKSSQNIFIELHKCDWEEDILITENFTLHKTEISLQNFTTENKFDIIYFDAFSPEKQAEMWTSEIFEECFNLLNKNGFLVTYCAKGVVKRTLNSVGFEIESLDGPPGKRQMTRANKLFLKN